MSPVNYNTVRVTWYGVQGAVGYKVFARDEGGDLILSQTVTGATSLTLSDNRLSGQYVNYTVAAYCNDYNTGAELYGAESKAARLKVQLYAPANVTATVIDSDTVSISWAAVANAEGYRISRKVGTATTFTEMEIIKTPDTRQCFDAKLVSDVDIAEKVVYQVEAWLDSAEADAYGAPKTSNTIYRVPAIPQNMPISNFSQMCRFSDGCGTEVPRWLRQRMQAYGDDSASIRALGLDVITELCDRLLQAGAPGLHFYTLNQAGIVSTIWQRLGL